MNRSPLSRNTPINPVSDKRRAQNRERSAMADRRWPGRREGTVACIVPDCPRPADDLHEILTRARCGSITDEENCVPLCRQHNGDLTLEPPWAYELHLLRHSWSADRPIPPAGSPLRRRVLARDGSRCTGCGCRLIDVPFALWCRAGSPDGRPGTPALWLAMCGLCAELEPGEMEHRGYVLRDGEEPAQTGVMAFSEGGGGATRYPWDDGMWRSCPQPGSEAA